MGKSVSGQDRQVNRAFLSLGGGKTGKSAGMGKEIRRHGEKPSYPTTRRDRCDIESFFPVRIATGGGKGRNEKEEGATSADLQLISCSGIEPCLEKDLQGREACEEEKKRRKGRRDEGKEAGGQRPFSKILNAFWAVPLVRNILYSSAEEDDHELGNGREKSTEGGEKKGTQASWRWGNLRRGSMNVVAD